MAFIRAPKIILHDNQVSVLATHENYPVWVRNDHHMATTFHPELNPDAPSPMHRYFLEELVQKNKI